MNLYYYYFLVILSCIKGQLLSVYSGITIGKALETVICVTLGCLHAQKALYLLYYLFGPSLHSLWFPAYSIFIFFFLIMEIVSDSFTSLLQIQPLACIVEIGVAYFFIWKNCKFSFPEKENVTKPGLWILGKLLLPVSQYYILIWQMGKILPK